MRKPVLASLFVTLALTASVAVASQDPAPAPSAPAAACSATITPAESAAGTSVTATATLSSSIGEVTAATITSESGATISDVKAEGNQVQFKIDLTNAAAGAWKIELTGANGTCSGAFSVTK